MQDMKRRTNHEKAACTRLYASRRIICRTWEHTNRALIFQSVPLSQPLGDGTVGQRDNSRKPNIKKSHEQLFITEI